MFEKYKRKKLEDRRNKTLSIIRGERLAFEEMLQRPRQEGDAAADPASLTRVRECLTEIEQKALQEMDIDELDRLSEDAEQQGQQRAYSCPRHEIRDEGTLAIDLMEEWNVPKTVIAKLRGSLGQKLEKADTETEAARGALRALFEEQDSWAGYTSEYEDEMRRFTLWWLFWPMVGMLLLAIITLRFPVTCPLGLSISLAGAAGSCASVMSKMPVLEVGLSGELESYGRRILSRVGVGVIASIIGSGLLGWGVISVQGQTFADVLNACSTSPPAFCPASCTGLKTLIILSVPMLFGFSERALTSFEQKVFGNSGQK